MTFDRPAADVIGAAQDHTIIFSEAVTDVNDSAFSAERATVNSVTVTGSSDTYTINFTPTAATFSLTLAADSVTDLAGNTGPPTEVIALPSLAFTAKPVFISSASDSRIKHGDTLTLTFTVNQALASDPRVWIAGHLASVAKGTGNSYTAIRTISGDFIDYQGKIRYHLYTMTAAGNPTNTLGPIDVTSEFILDTPTLTVTIFDNTPALALSVEQAVANLDAPPIVTIAVPATDAPVAPRIALAVDTGSDTSDGITMNGVVNVTVADGATWKHTIKGITSVALVSSVTTFTLDEGVYLASEVQVVQTVNSVASVPASFGRRITIDRTAPTVGDFPALGKSTVGKSASVKITFDQAIAGLMSSDFTATNADLGTVTADEVTTYIVTYTPNEPGAVTLTLTGSVTDLAGNPVPATEASAAGIAAAAAPETTGKPRFVASTRISGLTTAEFDERLFCEGIAELLIVDVDDVRILSITAGSVVVAYEVVADTDAERDARAAALSAATITASDIGVPGTAAVTTTSPVTRAAESAEQAVAEVVLSEVARAIADQNISAIAGRVERARTTKRRLWFQLRRTTNVVWWQ